MLNTIVRSTRKLKGSRPLRMALDDKRQTGLSCVCPPCCPGTSQSCMYIFDPSLLTSSKMKSLHLSLFSTLICLVLSALSVDAGHTPHAARRVTPVPSSSSDQAAPPPEEAPADAGPSDQASAQTPTQSNGRRRSRIQTSFNNLTIPDDITGLTQADLGYGLAVVAPNLSRSDLEPALAEFRAAALQHSPQQTADLIKLDARSLSLLLQPLVAGNQVNYGQAWAVTGKLPSIYNRSCPEYDRGLVGVVTHVLSAQADYVVLIEHDFDILPDLAANDAGDGNIDAPDLAGNDTADGGSGPDRTLQTLPGLSGHQQISPVGQTGLSGVYVLKWVTIGLRGQLGTLMALLDEAIEYTALFVPPRKFRRLIWRHAGWLFTLDASAGAMTGANLQLVMEGVRQGFDAAVDALLGQSRTASSLMYAISGTLEYAGVVLAQFQMQEADPVVVQQRPIYCQNCFSIDFDEL